MLAALGFLTGVAGAMVLYLGSPRQQLLRQPLQTWLGTLGGAVLLTLSTGLFAATFVVLTAFFVVFTVAMLVWSVVPLLIAFLRYRRASDSPARTGR